MIWKSKQNWKQSVKIFYVKIEHWVKKTKNWYSNLNRLSAIAKSNINRNKTFMLIEEYKEEEILCKQ